MGQSKLNLSYPDITSREINTVVDILKSGQLSMGRYIEQFEQAFANYVGVKYAIAVNSGTSGLHLAVRSLGLKEGDEVITTPFSFIASSNCLLFEGVKPVFVDIEPHTYNIDVCRIEEKITSRTKAILPVHIFGTPVDMDPLLKLANTYNLKVLEDACEALGTEYRHKKVGSFGDISVFGFYPNKQITTGEGGMVLTNDANINKICRIMRNQGRDDNRNWFNHIMLGFNYRMDEISAGIGYVQLQRIDDILARRFQVAKYYDELLGNLCIRKPIISASKSWFVYVVEVWKNRKEIMNYLATKGIPSRPYFSPIHLQPLYVEKFGFKKGDYPVTEEIAERTLALPFHSRMTRADVEFVVDTLKRAFELYY